MIGDENSSSCFRESRIYEDYRDWCNQSGVRHITGKNTFFKEVIHEFNLSEKRTQHKVDEVRKWYFKSLEPEKNCA